MTLPQRSYSDPPLVRSLRNRERESESNRALSVLLQIVQQLRPNIVRDRSIVSVLDEHLSIWKADSDARV